MSGRETDTERDRERDRLRERENMLLMIRSVCLIKPSLAGKADRKTHTDFSIRCRSPPTERERWRTRGMDGWMERESRLRGRLHDNVERKTFHAVWRFVYTTMAFRAPKTQTFENGFQSASHAHVYHVFSL